MIHTKKAFTLVELIVVITILAILWTIGFISLQGYSSKSRDSTQATNLSLAARSLETYQVNTSRYPSPDNITGTGQIGGVTIALTGVFGDTVAPLVKLDKAPKDPLTSNSLAYWVDINNRQYQIAATFEGALAFDVNDREFYAFGPEVEFKVWSNSVQTLFETFSESTIPTAHAAGTQVARVAGNYEGIIRVDNGIYNTPSLIFFSGGTFIPSPTPINLASTNTRLITNNGTNIPYAIQDATQGTTLPTESLAAVGSTATSLTGVTITDWNTQSGSLATTLGYPIETIGISAYGTKGYVQLTNWWDAPVSPLPPATIALLSGSRLWSNGTVAESCNDYRNPDAPNSYSGSTGDWLYRIKPLGQNEVVAYCDMLSGGYTLVANATYGSSVGPWMNSTGSLNVTSNPVPSSTTFKYSDDFINALPKTRYRVASTLGYQTIRYWNWSCIYNHVYTSDALCVTSYSDEWLSMGAIGWITRADLWWLHDLNPTSWIYVATAVQTYAWAGWNWTNGSVTWTATVGSPISLVIWVK